MSDTPRYTTLRDYLRVLRMNRLLILAVALACAGAGYAIAKRQQPTYQAAATLSFRAEGSDLDVLEGSSRPRTGRDIRPAVAAEMVRRREVVERVRRSLGARVSARQLRGAVEARVTAPTNLLVIDARWDDAGLATKVANAYARAIRNVETANQRRVFESAARSLRRRFAKSRSRNPFTRAAFEDRIARLEAVAEFARPLEIVRLAEAPGSPASPKPLMNTALGLLLGATLGIAAAFLRDVLDRRLRGSHDVREHLELPLLGHVSDQALGRVPTPNGNQSLSHPDIEAFRILRANLDFSVRPRPRTVAVTSGLPEEGKSTVAVSLAGVTALAGRSCVLVECDLRRPGIAGRLGIAREPGVSDYLAGRATAEEVLQTVPLSAPQAGLARQNGDGSMDLASTEEARMIACITAGSPTSNSAELLSTERLPALLEELRERFELVVLDTAPLLSVVDTRELLPHMDAILLCLRSGRTTREEASAAKDALAKLPSRPTGLVVTGLRAGDEAYYGYYSYAHTYGS